MAKNYKNIRSDEDIPAKEPTAKYGRREQMKNKKIKEVLKKTSII